MAKEGMDAVMGLSVKLLGQFEVRSSAGEVLSLPTRKTRALLGYLTINAGKPQPRERLMALLWSDRGDKQARQSLNHSLRAIRKLAEDEGNTLLDSDGETVTLRGDALDSDVARFRQSLSDHPSEAADLYTGPFLDGLLVSDHAFQEWLRETQSQFHTQACDALQAAATTGDINTRLDKLRHLLVLDPLREEAHRELMQLLHQSGDRTSALRQYQDCVDILNSELEVEPQATTKALYEEIRNDAGIADLEDIKSRDNSYLQDNSTPQSTPQDTPRAQENAARKPISRNRLIAVMAVIVLITGVGLATWLLPQTKTTGDNQREENLAQLSDKPSLAVMPFTNLSDDKEQEYFSNGVTEDLIIGLSQISDLHVISRGTSFSVAQNNTDLRDIAETLKVKFVLTGSLRRVGENLRVSAALVDGKTGINVWAERFEGSNEDIFKFQEDLIHGLLRSLSIRLSEQERARLGILGTRDVAAHDAYLRGRENESLFTPQSNAIAIEEYQAAINIDPNFAEAYAHLAQVYSYSAENYWSDNPDKTIAAAFKAAKKAIALNDELSYAHFSLGRLYSRRFMPDVEKSIAEYTRAIELNPGNGDARVFLAMVLLFNGRAPEALPYIDDALRINPIAPFSYHLAQGMAFYFQGQYKKAEAALVKSRDQNPTAPFSYRFLIPTYGQLGQIDDAEWMMVEYEAIDRVATIDALLGSTSLQDPDYRALFRQGLEKAGVRPE